MPEGQQSLLENINRTKKPPLRNIFNKQIKIKDTAEVISDRK